MLKIMLIYEPSRECRKLKTNNNNLNVFPLKKNMRNIKLFHFKFGFCGNTGDVNPMKELNFVVKETKLVPNSFAVCCFNLDHNYNLN